MTEANTLTSFLQAGWRDHATQTNEVAARLFQAIPLVEDETGLSDLAHLAQHIYGEHLAAWGDGLAFLAALSQSPAYHAEGPSGQAVQRWRAALLLAGNIEDARAAFSPSERIRVGANAASAIALRDASRGMLLLQEALTEAQRAALPDQDPAHRALAITGNNIACALEEKPEHTPQERALMIAASYAGREYWQRAGAWREVERAEYRLAMTWIRAGDAAQAQHHARACLAILQTQAEPPALELFFAWEAIGQASRAARDTIGLQQATEEARTLFAVLSASDQAWCKESLDRLAA